MRHNGSASDIGGATAARVAESLGFGRVEATGHRARQRRAVLDYVSGDVHSASVEQLWGTPLDDELVAAVRTVSVHALWVGLLSAGLGASAAAAALVRLTEVAERGMITGESRDADRVD
ncbi:hypothetical protein [Nocardia sp. NPDC051463]|uniref:hypothetical protein n=1 Tax=Nocardia sp. NPDC051463 TaxID=3154845 RepID=UPI00344BA8AE